jgi:signal transduction histidine kinase
MHTSLRAIPAVVGIVLLLAPSSAVAQESATAEEVIQKTREAAEYLAKNKEAGIEVFKISKSPFVWKSDGYVYVFDCAAGTYLAHPHRPQATGVKLSEIIDDGGSRFGKRFCAMAGLTKGGWVEIQITKPGKKLALRKLAYVRSVEGTSYQVGSGIYDDTAKIEDLQKLSDANYIVAP